MLKALILCGGKSIRMKGKDKAFINIHGKPQYAYLYELLTEIGLSTFLSCSKTQTAKISNSYPSIIDTYQAIGPMGGIYTAMETFPKADWLVLACDLFCVDKETIEQLLTYQYAKSNIVTFQKKDSSFPETTITIYKASTNELFNKAVKQKQYSLQKILKLTPTIFIEPFNENALQNINTIDELEKLKRRHK